MYRKIDDNYMKLSRAIQESIERLGETQSERSIQVGSVEHLEKQVQLLAAAQKDLLEKVRHFESAMASKH